MTSNVDGQTPALSDGEQRQKNIAGFARRNALQLGIIAVFIALWIFFVIAAPDTFTKPAIYKAFMQSVPLFGIMALPLTMLIISGEMDLSFPSIMAMGTVTFLLVFDVTAGALGAELAAVVSLVAGLIAGFLIGLLNGLLVVRVGIPSLIATIGTQFFWRGMVLIIREGRSGSLVESKNSVLGQVLVGKLGGQIPMQMIWYILIAILVWTLLNRHRFGAHTYLIGDNEQSARLMGVNVDLTKTLLFALVGVASAFAGITASLHVANFFTTLGEGHMMTTLAAVFLGGTSVFGGTGTILGTFIGAFIIGSVNAGIVAIGLTGFYTQVIYGLIITVSTGLHAVLNRRMS